MSLFSRFSKIQGVKLGTGTRIKSNKILILELNLIMFFDMKSFIIIDLTTSSSPGLQGFIDHSLGDFLDLIFDDLFKAF